VTRTARRGGGQRAGWDDTDGSARRKRGATRPRWPVSPGRYRRRRLAALLVGMLLLVGLGLTGRVLLYDMGLFDVEDVRVTGAGGAVAEPDVRAAAAVAPGGPLAAVDTGAVSARVARLPAVESVRVDRSWPHTVTVEITERVPVATVDTAQGPALVDRTGIIYQAPAAGVLPRLVFPAASGDPATLAAVAVLGALPDGLRTQVETVRATVAAPGAPGQVTLGLSGGREVRWGDQNQAADKAAVLVALLTQHGRVFDVTSPALPTVRR
jgi:cell division protein FtsQ